MEVHGIPEFHGMPWIPQNSMDSMDFYGFHGIPWNPWNSMESMEFHGFHGIPWSTVQQCTVLYWTVKKAKEDEEKKSAHLLSTMIFSFFSVFLNERAF